MTQKCMWPKQPDQIMIAYQCEEDAIQRIEGFWYCDKHTQMVINYLKVP